jgi:peptidoglycan/LPS O-acetylase OafA/YrhL
MMSEAFKAKRLHSIDALRGVAALAVVVWHWQHFYSISGTWATNWNRADQPFYIFLKPLYLEGWAAVDLFFAVSGFVFYWLYLEPVAKREIGTAKFALQRFSRLYPIYFLTLLVAAGLENVFHRATGNYFIFDSGDWWHFVQSIFLVQQWLPPDEMQWFNGPAWAVSIEVLLYLVFFAGARLRLGGPLPALLMVLVGVVLFPWEGQISRGITDFFVGGLVFYATSWIVRQQQAKTFARVIAAGAVLVWVVAIVEIYLWPIQTLLQQTPAPIAHLFAANAYRVFLFAYILVVCPLTLAALALHEELFGGPYARLAFLGDISYSTYMVHFPMQLTLALLALHFGWKPTDFMSGFAMIAFYAAMIALGALSYNYFERPMQALIRGKIAVIPAKAGTQ